MIEFRLKNGYDKIAVTLTGIKRVTTIDTVHAHVTHVDGDFDTWESYEEVMEKIKKALK